MTAASVEVRVVESHHAVFAVAPFRAGEAILGFDGVESFEPGRYSLQIGRNRHLFPVKRPVRANGREEPAWPFLNHSCSPNAFVHGRSLVALVDIAAGAELTFDYNTTEWELATPFECWCGHPSCVGLVRGYRWLSEPERNVRFETTAPYLLETPVRVAAAAERGARGGRPA